MTTIGVLDCGHDPSTAGTAHTSDGREICRDCALDQEREALRTATIYVAYLSGDGGSLTTWLGGHLAVVTWSHASEHVGFRGVRYTRTSFRAVDVHGVHWYGTSPGRGMYARMRRRKR